MIILPGTFRNISAFVNNDFHRNFNDYFTEKLANVKLDVPEVTQSQEGQKQKLRIVLEHVNRVRWTLFSIF